MLKKILLGFVLLGVSLVGYAKDNIAIFAGGCFWCIQADFDKLPGVVSTVVGFDGGVAKSPTYKQVSAGGTHYVESVKVTYDPSKVSYQQLLNYYWHHINPTQRNGQFCDHGAQYRSVIFVLNDQQEAQAGASLTAVKKLFPEVYTEILPSTTFYSAEAAHQKYYQKHSVRYRYYRWRCGRDATVEKVWEGRPGVIK